MSSLSRFETFVKYRVRFIFGPSPEGCCVTRKCGNAPAPSGARRIGRVRPHLLQPRRPRRQYGVLRRDAIYAEVNDPPTHESAAIRQGVVPLLSVCHGAARLDRRALFVGEHAGRILASRDCHLIMDGEPRVLDGLCPYHVESSRLVRKLDYCKACQPRHAPQGMPGAAR